MRFTTKDWKEYAQNCGVAEEDVKKIITIANKIGKNISDKELELSVFHDAMRIFLVNVRANATFKQTNEKVSNEFFLKFVNKEVLNVDEVTNPLEEYIYVLGLIRHLLLKESFSFLHSAGYIEKLKKGLTVETDLEKAYFVYAFEVTEEYISKQCV